MRRAGWWWLLLLASACNDGIDGGDAAPSDARTIDAPPEDAPRADVPGLDAPGRDAPGGDAPDEVADAPRSDGGSEDELTGLPADTGGAHTPRPLGTTDAAFGYYEYLPGGYAESDRDYPLLVFLHGQGERGNGVSELDEVLRNGVPDLIDGGRWDPTYPMIVVSPQYPAGGPGNPNNWGGGSADLPLRGFIEDMIAAYRVNEHRIYLTGLSHGGNGVYDYLMLQEDEVSLIAAAAPIAAWGPSRNFARANDTPIWVFVGSEDGSNFTTSRTFATGYNDQDPPPRYPARFTVYDGAGHNVWSRTYDLSGMGTEDPDYDPYDVSLYDWMFSHRRD